MAEWAADGVRGEIVVVIEGAGHSPHGTAAAVGIQELVQLVEERVVAGERRKAAAKAVATQYGVSANELFEASVRATGHAQ